MTAVDTHSDIQKVPMDGPAIKGFSVTPHNTNELTYVTRAVYIGGVGDLEVILQDDTDPIIFKAVPAGSLLPIRAKIIKAANTTATLILGLV